MPYLCQLTESNTTYVAESKPDNVSGYETIAYFQSHEDAVTAQRLLSRIMRFKTTEKTAVIEIEIQEQKELIKKQAAQIEAMRQSFGMIRARITAWLTTLAIDLVISRTHRERNEVMRPVIQGMYNWLSYQHEDMDGIPF